MITIIMVPVTPIRIRLILVTMTSALAVSIVTTIRTTAALLVVMVVIALLMAAVVHAISTCSCSLLKTIQGRWWEGKSVIYHQYHLKIYKYGNSRSEKGDGGIRLIEKLTHLDPY